MEILLVSPVRPIFVILSKAVPYLVLSLVNLATILLLSRFVLDVPVAGSVIGLLLVSLLFILVSLASRWLWDYSSLAWHKHRRRHC